MKWFIIILLFIVIISVLLSSISLIDNFTNNNVITCKDRILNYKNFNLNDLTEQQQKVLFTLIPLKAKIYEDNKLEHSEWQNACVIPKSHFPIFNLDKNKTDDWNINNNKLKYTNVNQNPEGFVIDLDKYDETSFKQLLSDLYPLYDKEFLDAKIDLENKINQWTEARTLKQLELATVNTDIITYQTMLNNLTNADNECQINKRNRDDLFQKLNK